MKINLESIAVSALAFVCVGALSIPFFKVGELASSAYQEHSIIGKDTLSTTIRSIEDGYTAYAFDSQSACLSFDGETPFEKVGGCAILDAKAKLAHEQLVKLMPEKMENKDLAGFSRLHSDTVVYTLPIYMSESGYAYWNDAPVQIGVSLMMDDDISSYNKLTDTFKR